MIFQRYESGKQFIEDNKEIFRKNPIETSFFVLNALNMPDMSNGFAVKVTDNDKFVLSLRFKAYPMLIFGDDSLLQFLASKLLESNYSFERILGPDKTVKEFLTIYEHLVGGTHQIVHTMDLMICDCIKDNNTDISIVENAKIDDVEEISKLLGLFEFEVGLTQTEYSSRLENVKNSINNFVLIRTDNKIASFALKCRENDESCAISDVYTRKEYRGRGFSRKIMIYITSQILRNGKKPYLFVDKKNPVTNHLYSSIGFVYISPQTEIMLIPAKRV